MGFQRQDFAKAVTLPRDRRTHKKRESEHNMTKTEAIQKLEMVADDLYDSCKRTMASALREVVKHLEDGDAWKPYLPFSAVNEEVPFVPVLVKCEWTDENGFLKTYCVVAELKDGQWYMCVVNELIKDRVTHWKTID